MNFRTYIFKLAAIATVLCSQGVGIAESAESESIELRGEIVSISRADQIMRLRHDATEGVLPAGETDFTIGKGDSLIFKVGNQVRGQVVRSASGFQLTRIWPIGSFAERVTNNVNRQLHEDTLARNPAPFRHIGEPIPEFALYNQDGKVVLSRSLLGNKVVLNFIYTRCPMPMMCPAATQRMQNLQKKAKEKGVKNLLLLSMTFDPEFDSPGILKDFMANRSIDESNFKLLSGKPEVVADLLQQFGVAARKDIHSDTYDHTMATILIDEEGKIAYRKDGAMWDVEDFLNRL